MQTTTDAALLCAGHVVAVYTEAPIDNNMIKIVYEIIHRGAKYTPVIRNTDTQVSLTYTKKALEISPRQVETGIRTALESAGLVVRNVLRSDSALGRLLLDGARRSQVTPRVHLGSRLRDDQQAEYIAPDALNTTLG